MPKTVQQELFRMPAAETIMADIERRLPKSDYVAPSDVAAACCGVSMNLVYAWIEEGLVQAINLGSGEKPYWKVHRDSVLEFYRGRLGIEEEATAEGRGKK